MEKDRKDQNTHLKRKLQKAHTQGTEEDWQDMLRIFKLERKILQRSKQSSNSLRVSRFLSIIRTRLWTDM
jgi:hypothetical protein